MTCLRPSRRYLAIYRLSCRRDLLSQLNKYVGEIFEFRQCGSALPIFASDETTLRDFFAKIERQYGKAQRVWLMDRSIPTEETLAEMRQADPHVQHLLGTPTGRLNLIERFTGLDKDSVVSGHAFVATNNHIDIERVELNAAANTPCPLSGDHY